MGSLAKGFVMMCGALIAVFIVLGVLLVGCGMLAAVGMQTPEMKAARKKQIEAEHELEASLEDMRFLSKAAIKQLEEIEARRKRKAEEDAYLKSLGVEK